ncbi:hypothetical protein DSECCO2_507700 [anaerobic digester metagenome]
MFTFATVKRWLYLISLMLFFVANTNAANSGFLGAREVVAAKGASQGFRSFSSFKRAMGPAGPGQAWHHIVEQNPANIAKFGPEAIHNTGNMMKLPHGAGSIHMKVTGHYNSLMPGTSMRVRDYVNTLNYQQQYQYGLDVLKRFGW